MTAVTAAVLTTERLRGTASLKTGSISAAACLSNSRTYLPKTFLSLRRVDRGDHLGLEFTAGERNIYPFARNCLMRIPDNFAVQFLRDRITAGQNAKRRQCVELRNRPPQFGMAATRHFPGRTSRPELEQRQALGVFGNADRKLQRRQPASDAVKFVRGRVELRSQGRPRIREQTVHVMPCLAQLRRELGKNRRHFQRLQLGMCR